MGFTRQGGETWSKFKGFFGSDDTGGNGGVFGGFIGMIKKFKKSIETMWGLLIPEIITDFMSSIWNLIAKKDKEISKEKVREGVLSALSGAVMLLFIPLVFNVAGLASSTVSTTAIIGKKVGKSVRKKG